MCNGLECFLLILIRQVVRKLGQLYSEMIFVKGYIHCDPHPGNILVRQTEKGTQIVLLDHGLYQVSWGKIESKDNVLIYCIPMNLFKVNA